MNKLESIIYLVLFVLVITSCNSSQNLQPTTSPNTQSTTLNPEPNVSISPQPATSNPEFIAHQSVNQLLPEINSIVSISSGNQIEGSGVVIAKTKEKLYILTASHVIREPDIILNARGNITPQKITTFSGDQLTIDFKRDVLDFSKDGYDLSLIILKSNNINVNSAKLFENFNQKSNINLIGYLPCVISEELTKSTPQKYHLSTGKIENPVKNSSKYIKYNNNTIPSMSGSPVFDVNHQLIAIHTEKVVQRNIRYDAKTCKDIPENPNDKYGPNQGVLVSNLKNLKHKLPPAVVDILNFKEISKPKVTNLIPPSSDTCPPFGDRPKEC